MESMAEYDSNELREKVQRGQNVHAEKGIWNGGGKTSGCSETADILASTQIGSMFPSMPLLPLSPLDLFERVQEQM